MIILWSNAGYNWIDGRTSFLIFLGKQEISLGHLTLIKSLPFTRVCSKPPPASATVRWAPICWSDQKIFKVKLFRLLFCNYKLQLMWFSWVSNNLAKDLDLNYIDHTCHGPLWKKGRWCKDCTSAGVGGEEEFHQASAKDCLQFCNSSMAHWLETI